MQIKDLLTKYNSKVKLLLGTMFKQTKNTSSGLSWQKADDKKLIYKRLKLNKWHIK